FRGWLNYNRNGQIEIRTREPADNAYLRASSNKGTTLLPINNIKPWVSTFDGFLLIGVGVEHTEIRKVKSVAYSPGCNNMPIVVSTGGSIIATVSPIEGGSLTNRGVGYIDFSGTVGENVEIKLTFNNTPDDFTIAYVTDGVESISTLTRIIGRYLNANPDFSNYLTAYTINTYPNRLYIQCEAGFLELDKPLEYDHIQAEEVMRVEAVFENCGELDSDASSTFDNIIIDSFSWNTNEIDNTPNAYTCIYTSAVDDFNVAKILPRTYWDIVDLEGELNVEELDLKMIDNYWQAAYVTKTIAIENIYGKTQFNWRTGVSGFTLDIGDVVTIRHDSGDGAIRYLPLWIESISYNLKDLTTDITARLYISGAWNHQVQEVDQVLTVSLNPNFVPFTPDSTGTTGGYGWTTQSYWYPGLDARIRINDNDYLAHDAWGPDTRWTKYGPSYVFNGMPIPNVWG
ncbi:MAG: hypothetical protein LC096_03865, partial [Bacteroidia bacterium]|nr:hypothetical protein [Bacteroidia bacterium]